jgi:hypothetical protein
MEKDIKLPNGEIASLMVWDTAGQDMFNAVTKQYYRGAVAVVYVFSTPDRDSFLALQKWHTLVTAECGPAIVPVIIQNKIDQLDRSATTPEEVEAFARRMNARLYRVSLTSASPLPDIFEHVAATYLRNADGLIAADAAVPAMTSIPSARATASGATTAGGSAQQQAVSATPARPGASQGVGATPAALATQVRRTGDVPGYSADFEETGGEPTARVLVIDDGEQPEPAARADGSTAAGADAGAQVAGQKGKVGSGPAEAQKKKKKSKCVIM